MASTGCSTFFFVGGGDKERFRSSKGAASRTRRRTACASELMGYTRTSVTSFFSSRPRDLGEEHHSPSLTLPPQAPLVRRSVPHIGGCWTDAARWIAKLRLVTPRSSSCCRALGPGRRPLVAGIRLPSGWSDAASTRRPRWRSCFIALRGRCRDGWVSQVLVTGTRRCIGISACTALLLNRTVRVTVLAARK